MDTLFNTRKAQFELKKQDTQKRLTLFVYARLAVLLLTAFGIYQAVISSETRVFWIVGSISGIAAFLYLVAQHQNTKEKWAHWQALIDINAAEAAYTQGHLDAFEAGNAYIAYEHPFTYSLDIFGEKSLFHHLNRTVTARGQQKLAHFLSFTEGVDIQAQQKAVAEWIEHLDFRQDFQAYGQKVPISAQDTRRLDKWLAQPMTHASARLTRIMAYVGPAAAVLLGIGVLFTNIEGLADTLKIVCLLNLAAVARHRQHLRTEQEAIGQHTALLSQYAQWLQHIEHTTFQSAKGQALQARLQDKGLFASSAIRHLAAIGQRFDLLNNPVATLFMNAFLQYHVHALHALSQWHRQHAAAVDSWFDVVAEVDVLNSIANFAHHQGQQAVFPTLSDTPKLCATDLAHPLLPLAHRVGNDVAYTQSQFIILTGSNMAGKSTFLRTLGINLVLTRIGAPVCAKTCTVYPFDVSVSMRINDSLHNSESFFFAELKQLRRILEQIDQGTPTFIILDEILRGTNSNDKRAGTQGLIRALERRQAIGIIATHDLVIGDMAETYPNYLKNHCFEVNITPNGLEFDYKLRAGVCQKMSATHLMRQMNIIEP